MSACYFLQIMGSCALWRIADIQWQPPCSWWGDPELIQLMISLPSMLVVFQVCRWAMREKSERQSWDRSSDELGQALGADVVTGVTAKCLQKGNISLMLSVSKGLRWQRKFIFLPKLGKRRKFWNSLFCVYVCVLEDLYQIKTLHKQSGKNKFSPWGRRSTL